MERERGSDKAPVRTPLRHGVSWRDLETLTRDAAGTRSRSLLKRLVYKRADMAHADPISTCHPRLLATDAWAVTHDQTKGTPPVTRLQDPSQSLKVPGTGVSRVGCVGIRSGGMGRMRCGREGLDFPREKRDVPQGLWVFLPALGLTVDHLGCQI